MEHSSLFISFEGLEGCGKTTQIKKLVTYFEAQGKEVHTFREPGGTSFGETLRTAILGSTTPLHPLAEAYLFASSRTQLLHQKIIPLLAKQNMVVILDRFVDSSLVYQGIGRGLGIDTILEIHNHYPLSMRPQITFYIKICQATSLQRQNKRNSAKDYFEQESEAFYQSLFNGFEHLAKLYPQRIVTVDGEQNEESIFNMITKEIDERFT